MGTALINDDAMWFKHIKDAPEIISRANVLKPNEALVLRLDGRPVRFFCMRDGKDGRSTLGLRPDDAFKAYLRSKRGSLVELSLDGAASGRDAYLASIAATLSEWESPEDAAAYDGL